MKRQAGRHLPVHFVGGSLLAFLVVGIAVTSLVSHQLRKSEEDAAAGHARFVTDAILRFNLTPSDLRAPVRGSRYQALQRLVHQQVLIAPFPVVRVKVWRPDGTVVFSDEPRLVGRNFGVDGDLVEALHGEVASEVSDLSDPENEFERSLAPKLLSTYVPLRLPGPDSPPQGVVELYSDYAGIQSGINQVLRGLSAALLGGLAVLYVLIFPLTFRASRTLREQNAKLRQQATDLEGLLEKERRTVVELREANRAKDEFLAVASHELRTPLTAILGSLSTAMAPGLLDDQEVRAELVAAALRQTQRLQELVENVLAATRPEGVSPEPSVEPFSFMEVCADVLEGLGDVERISVHVPADLPPLRTERAAVERIVANLIDNALKFSDRGSPVEVLAQAEGPKLVFAVRDHGAGIPSQAVDRIFDRFYQVDSSSTRTRGGLGLGLAVVSELVQGLAGQIDVATAVGEGSTFTVTLPFEHPLVRASAREGSMVIPGSPPAHAAAGQSGA